MTRKFRSLRSRIIITLSVFSFLLSLIFSGMIIVTGTFSQDYIFNMEVKKVTEQIVSSYTDGVGYPSDIPEEFEVYFGLETVDGELVRQLGLDALAVGIYESQDPYDIHFTVSALPDTSQKLYVLYNVSELELPLSAESAQVAMLIIPAFLTTIVGVCIGLLLADKVLRPVRRLAEKVRMADPDNPCTGLTDEFSADEIGELAERIESYSQRLSSFIIREKEFTRNVSHELRTPLAVAKNGVELLRGNPDCQGGSSQAAIGRIDRAVGEMAQLVTTFLLLARENDPSFQAEPCPVYDLVEELTKKYAYLLEGRDIACNIAGGRDVTLYTQVALLEVIFGNVLRNALQYASDGTIDIFLKQDSLVITNAFAVQEQAVEGINAMTHGIGHSITARLCHYLGFRFTFEKNGLQALARIDFPAKTHCQTG